MSILTESLPDYAIVKGIKCDINSDFRTWLKVSELIGSEEELVRNCAKIFKLVFKELPPDFKEALAFIFEFLSHSQSEKTQKTQSESAETRKKYFDFEYDADLIYSAFMQEYKIDLCKENLHWWQFKSLLGGLSENTHFVKVIGFRSMDLSEIKSKEMKSYYIKMKNAHRLPDNRSEDEKESYLNSAIERLF